MLVELSYAPDRCGTSHYIATLCSKYQSDESTILCSYLKPADLAAAAGALLEADRLIKAGLDPSTFTDILACTTATRLAEDDTTICSNRTMTTFDLCASMRITELSPDGLGHRVMGSAAGFGFAVRLGGPDTPADRQIEESGITSLFLWNRHTLTSEAQFDGSWSLIPNPESDAESLIEHLCRGIAKYVSTKSLTPVPARGQGSSPA